MTALLAGPIVRRATDNRVCVWVATRSRASLKLNILNTDGETGAGIGGSSLDDLDESCCKLGEELYIYLLQARPFGDGVGQSKFPKDKLLYYRISVMENEVETPVDVAQLGLTYGGDRNPSFIIAKELKQVLHGSCRKTHGLETLCDSPTDANLADGLSYGDDQLSATYGDIDSRPSLLLLTGDQIYADEVPSSIMAMINRQVTQLIGFDEEVPSWPAYANQGPSLRNAKDTLSDLFSGGTTKAVASPPFKPAGFPLDGRKDAVKQTGFSTSRGENHLLAFGEYAAMYLYVFGNAENWLPDYAQDTATPGRGKAVEYFHQTLPKVRRLLANVCTYMLFDDHDVTDDWNITGYWYAKVRDSATGCRVVANALAAYWAFQGWGNDPDHFDKDLKWVIQKFVTSANPPKELSDRYDLQLWKHRGWGFSIPTIPPVIGIDSRTQRQPDIISNPPQLLDRYALDSLRVVWQKLKTRPDMAIKDQSWQIFIATTPVMGVAPVEGAQRFAIWLTGLAEGYSWIRWTETLLGKEGFLAEKIIETLDAEAWVSNRKGYVNFLATLAENMDIRQCVFLSGDVHYSFTADASFQRGGTTLSSLQLTSSPLCNSTGEKRERVLKKAAALKNGQAHHGAPPLLRTSWKVDIQLKQYVENGALSSSRVTNHCCLGLLELQNGAPVKHRLLTGNSELGYSLP